MGVERNGILPWTPIIYPSRFGDTPLLSWPCCLACNHVIYVIIRLFGQSHWRRYGLVVLAPARVLDQSMWRDVFQENKFDHPRIESGAAAMWRSRPLTRDQQPLAPWQADREIETSHPDHPRLSSIDVISLSATDENCKVSMLRPGSCA